jgi:hypothetical protein
LDFVFLKQGFANFAQAGLELVILLTMLPEKIGFYRHVPPCPATDISSDEVQCSNV